VQLRDFGLHRTPAFVEVKHSSKKLIARLLSINSLKAPALLVASTLQLALNLFYFRSISGTDSDLSGEDDVQHVNEGVSRDVHQFSEHGQLPGAIGKIALRIRNPAARSGQL
jgi:hypothetical protein